jgi:hypothetical protein
MNIVFIQEVFQSRHDDMELFNNNLSINNVSKNILDCFPQSCVRRSMLIC